MESISKFFSIADLLGLATLHVVESAHAASPARSVNVVLVRGAFDDGSSWDKVTSKLQAEGLNVVAVDNPLTSLADDAAATRRILDMQAGPVVLVGHSWGGVVITEVGEHPRVKALVYVASFAPSVGQSVNDLTGNYPLASGLGHIVVDKEGFVTMTPEGIAKHFAHDLPEPETRRIASIQKRMNGLNFDEKVSTAAWSAKPSWFVVSDKDRMIQPALQLANAQRISATTVRLPAAHLPQLSRPTEVAEVIIAAASGPQN
jgi:pimeloyl-ACP methyl ester carboxylesterase